mgnify:FL=1
MSYWDVTDRYMREHGGPPTCPACGHRMFPEDDHGRFSCFCGGRGSRSFDVVTGTNAPVMEIPQVDTTGMTDEEKAGIPPINRLHDTATKAEQDFLSIAMRGPDAMDDPAYWEASRALDEERKKAEEARIKPKGESDGKQAS